MICLNQVKLPLPVKEENLENKIISNLRISKEDLLSYKILKRSLDARKKPDLFYVYQLAVSINPKIENRLKKKANKYKQVQFDYQEKEYHFPKSGNTEMTMRPVIVGMGPAGLFCGYALAKAGFRPVLIERGRQVEKRMEDVEEFWKTGVLDPKSNVQFGEGGAGTFSDGKLNTLIKDPLCRGKEALRIFVECGAPESILYDSKPHIGTDLLIKVVKNLREKIIQYGGEVHFSTQLTGLLFAKQNLQKEICGIQVQNLETGENYEIATSHLVLAVGHSARDTFEMLAATGVAMSQKAFAIGVRVEHPQDMINESQYGKGWEDKGLPAAPYKLTHQTEEGRGVYTFCMCPGGYVVNASSEENRLAVNGMSYADRKGQNANSAVIVTLKPSEYSSDSNDILAGVAFQRSLEERACEIGQGAVPVQLFKDYCQNVASTEIGEIIPQIKGQYKLSNVRDIFPETIAASIEEGIHAFGHKIKGYDREDTILSGVESRTSSPVRIDREKDTLNSVNIKGLYPCGEGAGYAGGITSAAMDGLKIAEEIAGHYFLTI